MDIAQQRNRPETVKVSIDKHGGTYTQHTEQSTWEDDVGQKVSSTGCEYDSNHNERNTRCKTDRCTQTSHKKRKTGFQETALTRLISK
jgi:hypothetical protein